MNTRIKELRQLLGLTQKEFGEKIGFKSSISEIENGNAPILDRTIISICSVYGVSEKWLRYGEGSIFITENPKLNQFFETYNDLEKPLQEFLVQCAKDLLNAQNKM